MGHFHGLSDGSCTWNGRVSLISLFAGASPPAPPFYGYTEGGGGGGRGGTGGAGGGQWGDREGDVGSMSWSCCGMFMVLFLGSGFRVQVSGFSVQGFVFCSALRVFVWYSKYQMSVLRRFSDSDWVRCHVAESKPTLEANTSTRGKALKETSPSVSLSLSLSLSVSVSVLCLCLCLPSCTPRPLPILFAWRIAPHHIHVTPNLSPNP
jgi:hypothetical protein